MNSPDREVLARAAQWLRQGHRVHLCTVVRTWGSAPRPPGSILMVRDDGHLAGSVSGGCIEDDLADRARGGQLPALPALLEYGVSREEAQRFGIPCGGQLQICAEPLRDAQALQPLLAALEQRRLLQRSVRLGSPETRLQPAQAGSEPGLDGEWFHSCFGPQWRLLVIGANQLGALLAQMAQTLDFDVLVCDPREDMRAEWRVDGATWLDGMPDDVVLALQPDPRTAIVAVTHDPKLDDMALLEALKCDAFYVGALGSSRNQEKRRERLRLFDLDETEIARLRGPVGLSIGSRTPAEIAVAILAELVKVRSALRAVSPASSAGASPKACALS